MFDFALRGLDTAPIFLQSKLQLPIHFAHSFCPCLHVRMEELMRRPLSRAYLKLFSPPKFVLLFSLCATKTFGLFFSSTEV